MNITESLRESVLSVFAETDKGARARVFRDGALLALDAYESSSKISCLAEARAHIVKLSELVIKDVPEDVSVLQDLLKR